MGRPRIWNGMLQHYGGVVWARTWLAGISAVAQYGPRRRNAAPLKRDVAQHSLAREGGTSSSATVR